MTETNEETTQQPELTAGFYFSSPVYTIEQPDFLEIVTEVSEESLAEHSHDLDEIYPVLMSNSYYADPRLEQFTEFIGSTSWNILQGQGYLMEDKVVEFTEMWTQEHHKHSSMEQHIHGHGVHIVGFYFLETPEKCSKVVFHDPRPGKVQIALPDQNFEEITLASNMVNFEPKPGLMIFANSWLPHSFTRHGSDTPIKFVHFNLKVSFAETPVCTAPAAEVI